MRATIDRALQNAYSMPQISLLWINAALAGFVMLAHGGALLGAQSQNAAELGEIRTMAMFSLPLGALVLASAVMGFLQRSLLPRVMVIHAAIVALSAVALAFWALTVLFGDVPDERFVWMVGILTAWVGYASVLAVRFLFGNSASVYYVPVFALVLAAVIDIGVMSRVF